MAKSRWDRDGIPTRIGEGCVVALVLVCISYVFDLPSYFGMTLFMQQYFGVCFALALTSLFLLLPPTKVPRSKKLPWIDVLLALASLVTGFYVAILYPSISLTIGVLTPARIILGVIFVFISLEAVRRVTGWPLVIIVCSFLLYAHFSSFAPGNLYSVGIPWARLMSFLYLDPNAVLGLVAKVTFGVVLPFILLGRLLFAAGGGKFLTDLATGAMGKYRGGPAKVAVLGSALFGTMSGSAVSDVATTGVITIPMMTKIGYKPEFAAAVEAVASSGGCILPPVMGAAAFLMAEFLEIPYTAVVIAALVPAILYYVVVFFAVDLEAARLKLQGVSRQELPSLWKTLAQGWIHLLPMAVLIYGLFVQDLAPGKAGMYAAASVVVVSLFKKETRFVFLKIFAVLIDAGRATLFLVAIAAVAGLIIGVVAITGLGFSFSQLLINASGGNLIALLFLTAVGCIVMGMGMPITASYILVVTLGAPALIQAGTVPIAAHLFVLYFAVMSFITPPVCLAVYTAASIAGSAPFSTAMYAMRLGITAYIVPFFFALNPALILKGSLEDILLAISSATIGLLAIEVAWEGFLFSYLSWVTRGLTFLGAAGLLFPSWIYKITGLCLVALSLLISTFRAKTESKRLQPL